MPEQKQEAIDTPASTEQREWIRPEAERLHPGSAEASDGADTDGGLLS